ncbi:hypothetical protein AAHA92_28929 [Salvia divinorum]|uniref:Glycine-rich protein n=1 Tax=Salvia divinorum TaxID=28513 RepID=A0ABD1FWN1_SALDI
MPPRTRSQGMAETHAEGGGEGRVGPSHSKPDGDLLSMMTQMWADLKEELRSKVDGLQNNMNGLQSDMNGLRSDVRSDVNEIRGDVKVSEIHMQTLHNTMFEEINAVKRNRSSRSSTPRETPIPNVIPEAYNGEERYDGEYARNRGGNWGDERLGMGNGVHGRFGNGNGRNGDWRYEDYKSYGGYSREMHGGVDDESMYHGYWENDRFGRKNGAHGRFGNENGMNGEGRYEDYKSYEGYSRDMHGGGDYESRYHVGGFDRGGRGERVTRLQEESRLRLNEKYERLRGYGRKIERDALWRARRESSSGHGDYDNTQSRIPPWTTDTSHTIASPKSSFESTLEQLQRMISSRNEKNHDPKCKSFGYEAKEECKYKAYDPLRKE